MLSWDNPPPEEPEELEPPEIRFHSAPDGSVCERCGRFIRDTPTLLEYLAYKRAWYFDEKLNRMAGPGVKFCTCGPERSESEAAIGRKPVDPQSWWKDI